MAWEWHRSVTGCRTMIVGEIAIFPGADHFRSAFFLNLSHPDQLTDQSTCSPQPPWNNTGLYVTAKLRSPTTAFSVEVDTAKYIKYDFQMCAQLTSSR